MTSESKPLPSALKALLEQSGDRRTVFSLPRRSDRYAPPVSAPFTLTADALPANDGEWRVTRVAQDNAGAPDPELEAELRERIAAKMERVMRDQIIFADFEVYESEAMPDNILLLVRRGWTPKSPSDVRNAERDGNIQIVKVGK